MYQCISTSMYRHGVRRKPSPHTTIPQPTQPGDLPAKQRLPPQEPTRSVSRPHTPYQRALRDQLQTRPDQNTA
ncbi:hypothetical protein E5345_12385 [Propionibacterium sp. NM47_B9-13]|nr:hypothetical protein E5345_12385 [Propionibacterium sp. NM47_B9-13]